MFDAGSGFDDRSGREDRCGAEGAEGVGGAGWVDHAGLVSALRCAAGVDVAGWDDDALLAAARDVEVARSLLESFSGHVAVQLDARKTTEARCGLATPRWLAQSPRQAHRDCRARLGVAKRLHVEFPVVDRAVADGRLSWAHAQVIVQAANPRIASEMAQIQEALIDAADGCVFEHWAKFIKGLARQLDVDGGYDPSTDISSNKATLRVDTDGTAVLNAELVAANAIVVNSAIEAVTDELFRRYSTDRAQDPGLDIPRRATLRALAIVEICRRAHAVSIESHQPPINLSTIVIHTDDPTGTAHTPDGGRHPAVAVEALRCDERLQTLLTSTDGVPLNMGRSSRLATPAQRRATKIRDGGCVFPGCDVPASWCVIHHPHQWQHGGQTNTDNLANLCAQHHGLVHRNDWHMQHAGDQWFTFTTPTGTTLHSQRHGRTRHNTGDPPHDI